MTHDELLAKIYDSTNGLKYEDIFILLIENTNALRAVVELHKPEHSIAGYRCTHCTLEVTYPCPTIRAIEKEIG
jgi:hypothetical protein